MDKLAIGAALLMLFWVYARALTTKEEFSKEKR